MSWHNTIHFLNIVTGKSVCGRANPVNDIVVMGNLDNSMLDHRDICKDCKLVSRYGARKVPTTSQ